MTAQPSTPPGWTAAGPTFFDELAVKNTREWWQANRRRYDHDVVAPMTALAELLSSEFGQLKIRRPTERRARNVRNGDFRLPELIIDLHIESDPEHAAVMADSVGIALLVVLETLTPVERLSFVPHDVFGVPFDEIAPMVERSPDATRQAASRARRRIRDGNQTPDSNVPTPTLMWIAK